MASPLEFDAAALRYLAARGIVLPLQPEGLVIDWGGRACRSYDSLDTLAALVVPYFREGLERDERCIWQPREGLSAGAARRVIAPLAGFGFSADQIDIVEAGTEIDWAREEARALGEGYRGLRIGGERLHRPAHGSRTRTLCMRGNSAGQDEPGCPGNSGSE